MKAEEKLVSPAAGGFFSAFSGVGNGSGANKKKDKSPKLRRKRTNS